MICILLTITILYNGWIAYSIWDTRYNDTQSLLASVRANSTVFFGRRHAKQLNGVGQHWPNLENMHGNLLLWAASHSTCVAWPHRLRQELHQINPSSSLAVATFWRVCQPPSPSDREEVDSPFLDGMANDKSFDRDVLLLPKTMYTVVRLRFWSIVPRKVHTMVISVRKIVSQVKGLTYLTMWLADTKFKPTPPLFVLQRHLSI